MAGADHTSTLTAIPESYHFQPLESMIMSTSTMFYEWWVFISGSALLAGLSLDSDQGQGSLQIPFFHGRIKNQSQSSMSGIRGWENCGKHFWEGNDCGNYKQRHEESSFSGTADDGFVEFQVSVASPASIGIWQHAGIWQIIQILPNHEDMNYYWGGTVNYCTDLMCEFNEKLKH